MPTMRQVADHAGVSIATVSFVVNNTKPVTAATRARIEASMAELGYRPNAVARALASRRTRILALAYPARDHRLGGSGMEFMNAAAQAAGEHGYHLMIWPGANDGPELTELVGQQLVDGVILMEVQLDDPRVPALQSSGTPYALIGRTADPSGSLHVDIDFEQTTRDAIAAPVRASDTAGSCSPPAARRRRATTTTGRTSGPSAPSGPRRSDAVWSRWWSSAVRTRSPAVRWPSGCSASTPTPPRCCC